MASFSSGLAHKKAMNDLATLVTASSLGAMSVSRSTDVAEVAGTLRQLTPTLLDRYGRVAGQLSTQFYLAERRAAGVTSSYEPVAAKLDLVTSTDAAVGYTISRLASAVPFDEAAQTFAGSMSRLVLSVDRDTIVNNAKAERTMYRRIASPTGCDFCLYAASVADVVTETADKYHDHCRCTVVPLFDGRLDDEPAYYEEFRNLQSEAASNIKIRRDEIRPIWEADWKARGGRMGKNLNRDFLKANPDLALTSRNYLAEIARIRRAG